SDESSAIKIVKEVFTDTLSLNFAFINANFSVISKAIKLLEAVGTQLCEALSIVQHVQSALGRARGHVSDKVKTKFQSVLQRNAGYSTLCKISISVSGNAATFEDTETKLNSSDLAAFKYAPVTSCKVERSFSRYKTILSDNRRSLTMENLKMHLVIHCNLADTED
ncbi:uncharacterized protein LOC126204277, partial [Schistocerca nitens]|uniref:uncharacterized protein LOC126204277 n=1 Tax=Schistocerca nitens TaxID=7011 RepID=UPI0021172CDF